jgi:hypothetical protein
MALGIIKFGSASPKRGGCAKVTIGCGEVQSVVKQKSSDGPPLSIGLGNVLPLQHPLSECTGYRYLSSYPHVRLQYHLRSHVTDTRELLHVAIPAAAILYFYKYTQARHMAGYA